jgi:aspartate/methionine/tyrosine aminotransferase
VPRDLSVNATTRTLALLRSRGIPVIDLTVSNPTQVGLSYPPDLLAPLASSAALTYEPHPLGLRAAREAVAADFARRGLSVLPDRIALTASTSEAYSWLFKLLCDPGDNVLVPRPSYPLFEHLTVLESVAASAYRLEYHGRWRVDIGDVRHNINDRTKAILVVSPNNPTGSFLHKDDLLALDELCAARNLMLIGDEVFADYPLGPAPDSASVLHAESAVSCSLGGLSKSAGLPQVKLSWMVFGGATTHLAPLLDAYEVIADSYLSVSTPVQAAAQELILRGAGIRDQIQQRTRRNLAALVRAARDAPAVSVLQAEGGWSVVLQVPRYRSEESLVVELLTADHVLVHPGYFFDFEREAYVIISLLAEPATFDEGTKRLLARASARSGEA